MALTLVDSIFAKQQADVYASVARPHVRLLLKGFWKWQAEHGPSRQFQVVSFANLTGDTVVADAATKVYFIYLKKQNTATASFFKLTDHASVSAGDAAAVTQELNAALEEHALVYPQGWAQSAGATINASTTVAGLTDTSTGDGPDGFVVIGAA